MSKGTTPRAIRVDDLLWAKSLAVAKRRNESVSAVIRQALQDYIAKHEIPADTDS